MKLTTENIKRFEVINDESNSNDGRVIVAELTGAFEGVLTHDNAGWGITVDASFEDVVEAVRNGTAISDLAPYGSTEVEGIRFRNDYSKGFVVEAE